MVDPRRKRLIFLFLGNVASGVVALVVIFFGIVSTGESGPLGPLFVILAVPAVGTQGWRIGLERWERDQAKVKQAAWQACWVLIAWEVAALVATGIFVYVALSAMAPVPHFDHWKSVLDLILISAAVALALWFTWVRSRRMLDLLSPLPGMPEPGSESPYVKLNL
jgi:hypothetical protein